MLDARARLVYLDQLRPPEGYRLDRAIATTFSLDLLSLLAAPISMVLSQSENGYDILRDPIAVHEALRQTTNRLAVFCQQGHIAAPTQDTRLFSLLEHVVVEVRPPHRKGVFHPKTWVLRFESKYKPVLYRVMCLSRNLTFDRSWDTVLTLEGYVEDRQRGFAHNRPLVDFVQALPTLAVGTVPSTIGENIDRLAEELRRVRFEPPADFEDITQFIPLGDSRV